MTRKKQRKRKNKNMYDFTDKEIEEMRRLYEEKGYKLSEIAAMHFCTRQTVINKLKRAGIKILPAQVARKYYARKKEQRWDDEQG